MNDDEKTIKKTLKKYFEKNQIIRITLKSGYFYTGYIQDISENSLIFRDKYNEKIFISFNAILVVAPYYQSEGGEPQ